MPKEKGVKFGVKTGRTLKRKVRGCLVGDPHSFQLGQKGHTQEETCAEAIWVPDQGFKFLKTNTEFEIVDKKEQRKKIRSEQHMDQKQVKQLKKQTKIEKQLAKEEEGLNQEELSIQEKVQRALKRIFELENQIREQKEQTAVNEDGEWETRMIRKTYELDEEIELKQLYKEIRKLEPEFEDFSENVNQELKKLSKQSFDSLSKEKILMKNVKAYVFTEEGEENMVKDKMSHIQKEVNFPKYLNKWDTKERARKARREIILESSRAC